MTERLTILVEEKGTRVVKRRMAELGKGAKGAGDNVKFLKAALAGVIAAGVIVAFAAGARAAIELADALAEVSTLLGDVPQELAELEAQTHSLAVEFGSLPTEQAAGFYQIISAGAADAAEATDILRASNKLAVGGVTDVATAADGLTTVLNAYGDGVDGATAVSDALFVAMKAGKTTIGELSAAIGKVAPLAAQAGVGFDELLASVSALTKGGISTRESVTGVRAILAAIVKPTSEAAKLSKELGIEFTAAGLKSKGFAGFLEEVITKTGGSTAQMAQLFGGVEALVPILALAGAAGEDFAQILEDMTNKAGATEEAFEKIANSPGFQLGRLAAAAQVELIKLGNVVLPAVTAAARFLADNLGTIVAVAKGAAAAMLLLAAPSIVAGILKAVSAVRLLTLAMAANPIGIIVVALGIAISLMIKFADTLRFGSSGLATLGDVAAVVWDKIVVGLKFIAELSGKIWDGMTAGARGFVENASSFFGGLLSKVNLDFEGMANIAKKVANFMIAVFKSFIDVTIGNFRTLRDVAIGILSGIARSAQLVGLGLQAAINLDFKNAGRAFEGAFDGRTFDFSAATASAEETARTVGENFGRDFLGEAGAAITASAELVTNAVDSVFDEAEARAQNRAADARLIALASVTASVPGSEGATIPGAPGGTTGGGTAATSNANSEALTKENMLLKAQKEILEGMRAPLEDLNIQKLALKNLLDAGKISSEEFSAAMRDLNVEMTALDNTIGGGLLNGLARIAQEANNIGEQMSNFVVDAFNSATDAIVQFAKTGEFNVRQFFQDLFAQLLKLAANQLFSQLLGGLLGGGGGGLLSSLFGGGIPGFATGGEFTVGGDNSATDSQLVAFRATKGEKVSVETPGQQANGGGGGGTTVVQSPPVNVAAVLSPADIVGAFDNPEGETVMINMLQRNASTVQQIVSGS